MDGRPLGPNSEDNPESSLDVPAGPHQNKEEAWPAAEPLDVETVRMIRKSLDDPRPSIPAEEAFARVDARIAAYKAKHGL